MLWPMVVCSIVAVAFALERWLALRRSKVTPREFVDRFLERVGGGKIDRERALELCRANDCAAARVFARVVQHWGASTPVLQELADREIAAETQDLKRNVRALNATATLAPLLGLLGTVVGMIEAFDSLTGDLGGMGKNEALAHGISVALLATALGLVIAILSVVAYYMLIHKADALGRGLEQESNRLIELVAGDSVSGPLVELRR
jgi:biopolymer transport protein ExbB